jgi:hypothetical protein
LLGTRTFTAKARAELQTWGLSAARYLDVPHGYQQLGDEPFAVLLADLVQAIARLVGGAV